ncbi:MAG: enoyl-CoA hydratase/isomerase family protein, partial [bacterium]
MTELEQGILTVTVNRPDKLNALNRSVFDDLNALMDQVDTDPAIRGVILTGSGPKAFVAGADISEFTQLSKEEAMALAK